MKNKKLLIAFLFLAFTAPIVKAQMVTLVKEINTTEASDNYPKYLESNGTIVYFVAQDPVNGIELWKSDGTTGGTVLVKDINPGTSSSSPVNLTNIGGILYFRADDGTNGIELWKSDGTTSGTVMVKDINTGVNNSYPGNFTNMNGVLYFSANDGVNGSELWKSDGTLAGTVLVKDLWAGVNGGAPAYITNVNGVLYFRANDGVNGGELWKSDGTTAGTVMVKDINAGVNSSSPVNIIKIGSEVFFSADDGINGWALWKSDGTTVGTVMVKDLSVTNYTLRNFTNVNGTLFFRGTDDVSGAELWKSDGTTAGTTMVKDIRTGVYISSNPQSFINLNGVLYFSANDGVNGTELWKSDGTLAGTVLVKDLWAGVNGGVPAYITNVNGVLYFKANDGANGIELWKSDGTTSGTVMVKDIFTGVSSGSPATLTNVNGALYFRAIDGINGDQLWKSDGTDAGTILVKTITSGLTNSASISELININGTLFFEADDGLTGSELWKSDGTSAGTELVKDITNGMNGSILRNFTNFNSNLFFQADDGVNGAELWKSDGTTAGTILVKNIASGISGSNPSFLTDVNGTLFFQADDNGANGRELWKSNGTSISTLLVKDIAPGTSNANLGNFVNLNGTLFFAADDRLGINGEELWKSDGTNAGTVMVLDINPGSDCCDPYESRPDQLTNLNGILFFAATTEANGEELWRSEGTSAGTQIVADINGGSSGSYISYLTVVNGTLFFTANDGTNGQELWKSDGTAVNTVLVKDININPATGSSLASLTDVNGTLFFMANDGINGRELWKSDGTDAGTVMVKDIQPGSGGSSPSNFNNINGTLYFGRSNGELWKSDGTAARTLPAVSSGPNNIGGNSLVYLDNRIYISGVELSYIISEPVSQPSLISVSNPTSSSLSISFTTSASGASGYIAIRKSGSSPTGIPMDGPVYNIGDAVGDGTVAYVGSNTTFVDSGLSSSTTYYYDIYAYNFDGVAYVYRPYSPLEGSGSTFAGEPTSQPTNLSFTNITVSTYSVSFTGATGPVSGYIVLRKIGSPPTGIPSDASSYIIGSSIGDGSVVYVGNLTNFDETVLSSGTDYYYAIFSYNGSGVNTNYNNLVPLEGNIITLPSVPLSTPATDIQQTSFVANWDLVNGADDYLFDIVGITNLTSKSLPDTLVSDSIIITGVNPGTLYHYFVKARNVSGMSGNSDTVEVITIPKTPVITVSNVWQDSVVLLWDRYSGIENGYDLDISLDNFVTYESKLLSSSDTALVLTGLTPGDVYKFRLRSQNRSGYSPYSEIISQQQISATPESQSPTNLTTNSFTANWLAVNGASYYLLEVSKDEFQTLFFADSVGSGIFEYLVKDLSSGTTYQYKVRAGNSGGISPYSAVRTAITENIGISVLAASVNNPGTFGINESSVDLTITVSGGAKPYIVKAIYREILSTSAGSEVTLSSTNESDYIFTITREMFDELGLSFDIIVTDNSGEIDSLVNNLLFLSFTAQESPNIPFANVFGNSVESYQFFSIPYKINDNNISSIFDPVMGKYLKSNWRLLHYLNAGDGTGAYKDYTEGINKIELGKGYWFISLEKIPQSILVGAGKVNDQIPFVMRLTKGWNQIGNPYNVNISWNSVIASNGEDTNIEPIYMYVPGSASFKQGDVIQPFSGGFVWAEAATSISISPVANNSGLRLKNDKITNRNIDDPEWIMSITIKNEKNSFQQVAVGMHPEASKGKDGFDQMTLPRFFNYLEMYATHENYFYPWFSEDIQPTAGEYSWRFTMESSYMGEKVLLEWDNEVIRNNTSALLLVDEQEGRIIDMKEVDKYEFKTVEKRNFTVYYSLDPSKSFIPSSILLGDAYPNPATSTTIIPVTLPDIKDRYDIELVIYNMQGQVIKTLTKGYYSPGFYEFEWDEIEKSYIPNGIYLYRLVFADPAIGPAQKRIIIQH